MMPSLNFSSSKTNNLFQDLHSLLTVYGYSKHNRIFFLQCQSPCNKSPQFNIQISQLDVIFFSGEDQQAGTAVALCREDQPLAQLLHNDRTGSCQVNRWIIIERVSYNGVENKHESRCCSLCTSRRLSPITVSQ